LMTPSTTHDYLVTTLHDITNSRCDDIDDLYGIHCPHDWDQVTKRTTRWWQGWLTTPTDDVANLVWRPMWLLLTTCDDLSDGQNMTPMTLTTMGDQLPLMIHVTTCWWPWKFSMTSDEFIWRYLSPKSKDVRFADKSVDVNDVCMNEGTTRSMISL
jgi:hypothetical protein